MNRVKQSQLLPVQITTHGLIVRFFNPPFTELRKWLGEGGGVMKRTRRREGERLWEKTTRDGEKGKRDTSAYREKATCNS